MNKHYLKQFLSSILLLCASFIFATAQNLEVIGQLSYSQDLSDIWGYYDSSTGIEYAIVGVYNGTSIVSLADPTQPEELFFIEGAETIWRDMKVYDHYAYVINEGDNGMLIIDLAGLSDATPTIETFYWTGGNYQGINVGFSTAHNVFIDEKNYLYILGANFGVGGAIILDLNINPINPPIVGIYNERYVHDAFVRDDMLWTAEVNDGIMSAVDISDRSNPTVLGTVSTPDDFTHNCWLSDDSQYMFTTDEVSGGYLGAFNVSDVTDMKEVGRIRSSEGEGVIPHNTFVVGDFLVTSYYRDGVTIHDISNPNAMVQVGHYDTSPNFSGNGFNGCWGVFPYTHSGLIFASDMEEGLYILSPTYKNAAFLDGTITDADTGSGLSGVNITIEGTSTSTTSEFGGNFITGIAESGTYDVTFELWGYEAQTISVNLNNSETVFENITLQALPNFAIAGSILDATTGLPVTDAQVTISHPQVNYNLTTDVNGTFTVSNFWEADYTISVSGGWGYLPTVIETQSFSANDNYVSLYLNKGYYDDFASDYGWEVSGNAGAGVWELGEPVGTEFFVGYINPEYDVSTDIGDQCFVTGNGGGDAGNDDVDDGVTILTSPIFDLSTYQNASISYYRWFVNEGGQGSPPNDALTVKITNGVETVTVETVTNSQSFWVEHDFSVSDFITPTSNMQMIFEAADNPAGHLVEAGIDVFQILDDIVGIENQDEQAMQVSVYPNPVVSELQIDLNKLPADNYHFQLFDMYGRILFEKTTMNNEMTVKRQNWPAGMYYYNIVNDENKSLATGKVFLK